MQVKRLLALAGRDCYAARMEYIVSGRAPEECLAAIEAYFLREWPYRGQIHRLPGSPVVLFSEHQGFFAAFFRARRGVQVFATPEQDGSRLSVRAGRKNYAETFDAWLRSEAGLRARPLS